MTSSSTPANIVLWAGIVILGLATALIHLSLNFPDPGLFWPASDTSRCWRRCTCRSRK